MWFRKRDTDTRLRKELSYHYENLVRDFIAEGIDPGEAARRARLEFGGLQQIQEECRDVHAHWLRDFAADLRYAARAFRRSPGFAAVCILSLALGIGANTAIFTLIDAVMLRSLPVRQPGRLVQITRLGPDGKPLVVSYPLFEHFRDRLQSVSAAAVELSASPAILIEGAEEQVNAEFVSSEHYAVLGIAPAAGRLLAPADDVVSPAAPTAVISYAYWRRRFGLDPAAIGKTFTLRDRIFTIVGVTPERYQGTRAGRDPDITVPLAMMLSENARREPTLNMLAMLGRLKPGATVEQANAEMQVLWQSFLQPLLPKLHASDRARLLSQRAAVLPAPGGFNRLDLEYSSALLLLMGIVSLVLLLACANVSGLLLARAASRRREISIRLAIGAGRGRLLRQFLAESFLLALGGGVAGLVLARWFSSALVAMMANGGQLQLSTEPDWRVLSFTAAISVLACALAGLAPGWHALRANLNPALKEVPAAGHQWLGKALVVAQLAISLVLLVGAALFVGTLVKLYTVDLGLRTQGVLTFSVRSKERLDPARAWAAQAAIVDRLAAVPGVAAASAVHDLPIGGGLWTRDVVVDGYASRPGEDLEVGFNAIAPKYFATVDTPLLAGRDFQPGDTNAAPKVAIVNRSFARYFFGARSPIGGRVTSARIAYEIVGVVNDAKYDNLRKAAPRTLYIPWTQREGEQPSNYDFLARAAAGDPMRLAPTLERLVREADPSLRLNKAESYAAVVDRAIVTERIMATLGGFFGLLALIVAGLGIFGVMAFQVGRRTNEIGLRMALGSGRASIVAMVLREVAVLLALGVAVGAAAAFALSTLARTLLFGVTPRQPELFALSVFALTLAALAAAYLPARRAARVDPLVALRHD